MIQYFYKYHHCIKVILVNIGPLLLQVCVFTPPDSIDSAQFALNTAVKVINYYEKYFGIGYPLPKQGMSLTFS